MTKTLRGVSNNSTIKYELGSHKGKEVIFIRFDYDAALIARVKKLVGVQWSQSQKAW
jgi:integrase/recombinase XerD